MEVDTARPPYARLCSRNTKGSVRWKNAGSYLDRLLDRMCKMHYSSVVKKNSPGFTKFDPFFLLARGIWQECPGIESHTRCPKANDFPVEETKFNARQA